MSAPIVAVFGSSAPSPGHPLYDQGVRLGTLLARGGATVATGGYAGLMEAVSEGAYRAGGRVIGVTAPEVFPGRSGANRYVGEEVTATTMSERIHRLVSLADATIALPGSIGTLAEFMVAWNVNYVAPFRGDRPRRQVAVGDGWRRLMSYLAEEFGTDGSYVTCVDDVEAAARVVLEDPDVRLVGS